MIDWFSGLLPVHHQTLKGGEVFKILPDGEVDWRASCSIHVKGSFDDTYTVKSAGITDESGSTHLYISGNPSKFLQGHNIFGSNDLLLLVFDTYLKICESLNIQPSTEECDQVKQGDYVLTRIDINESWELPTRNDVNSWIRAAEYKSKTRHGRPQMKGGTLYFGKNSRRWSIKAYCKADEINASGHQLPLHLKINKDLNNWVENKLRIELTLRKLEFERLNIELAKELTTNKINTIFKEYIRRLDMNKQSRLSDDKLLNLPTKLRSTYILWDRGEDVRYALPKATFYRHRKELKLFGIDITFPKDISTKSNVVPLFKVLEAVPVDVPDWAYDQHLIHY